jgi:protein TonB
MNSYKHFIPFLVIALLAYGAFFSLKAPINSSPQNREKIKKTKMYRPELFAMLTQNDQAGLLKGELLDKSLYLDKDLPRRPKPKAPSRSKHKAAKKTANIASLTLTKAPLAVTVETTKTPRYHEEPSIHKIKRTFKVSPKKEINNNQETNKILPDAVTISGNKPQYPKEMDNQKASGLVVIKIYVTQTGKAKNPEVIQSSGYAKLDLQVIKFIGKERFMPVSKQGQKISSEQLYSFRFSKNRR